MHIGGCIQLSFSADSWSNQMEEKSKGKKPFWLSTKGISLLGNKAILNPPNSNKIWNSMSRLDVYSFYFVSPLKSRLIEEWVFFFQPTNPWRNYFFLSWSVASRATPVIRPPPSPFFFFFFFLPFCFLSSAMVSAQTVNWRSSASLSLPWSSNPNLLMAARDLASDAGSVSA